MLVFFCENGAGNPSTATHIDILPPVHNLIWLATTKINNNVTWWMNGIKGNTVAVTQPTGGGNGRLRIGGHASNTIARSILACVSIFNTGLDDATMIEEYNYTMGGAFGLASLP